MHQIVRAEPTDAGWIADLVGAAFLHLPVTAWLVPDPDERARVMPRNFQILVEYVLEHGEVDTTADRSGAALWLPRGATELPPPVDYDRRVEQACGAAAPRFHELDALFEKHHPDGGAHHHLALLGVRGDRQGQGIGSALLRHHHAELDRTGVPGFLEASSTGSRDLYARHGYQLLGEPYAVPNGALFWPMWREPATV